MKLLPHGIKIIYLKNYYYEKRCKGNANMFYNIIFQQQNSTSLYYLTQIPICKQIVATLMR